MKKFNIKKMARLKFGSFPQMPDNSGIYFILGEEDKIIYVGISVASLRERLSTHEKLDLFREANANWVAYSEHEDEDELIQWEKDCIVKYSPQLNIQNITKLNNKITYSNPLDCLKRLHELRVLEKQIAKEIELIKDEALEIIESEYNGFYTDKDYSFSVVTQSRWQYPEECKEAIKKIHAEYQKNGMADQYYSRHAVHKVAKIKKK